MEKYPHIENTYRQEKFIVPFLVQFPELLTETTYIIQEKIHGTNVRIMAQPDGTIVLGSRNRILSENENHMGLRQVLPKIKDVLSLITTLSRIAKSNVTIYGELHGAGIQKGIDYGKEKNILFFDMNVGPLLLSPEQFLTTMKKANLMDRVVTTLGFANSLKEALAFSPEFHSTISPSESWAEGIVIKPLSKVFYNAHGNIFYLKNKHPDFQERAKAPKVKSIVVKALSVLLPYITKGRVEGVVLREGGITSKKEIGNYINLVITDIVSDYIKDHPDAELTPNDKSIGKFIVIHLLGML